MSRDWLTADEKRDYDRFVIRNETIEECAKVAESALEDTYIWAYGEGIAAAIRALKDKP